LSGNQVVPDDRAQTTNFTGDTTKVFLCSFAFNIIADTLTLEFSEYVIMNSFDPTQITLLSSNGSNASSITLTGGN